MCEPFDLENAKANLSKIIQDNIPYIFIDNDSINIYNYNNLKKIQLLNLKIKIIRKFRLKQKKLMGMLYLGNIQLMILYYVLNIIYVFSKII